MSLDIDIGFLSPSPLVSYIEGLFTQIRAEIEARGRALRSGDSWARFSARRMGLPMFSKDQITRMVDAIVEAVRPAQVILFGSYARGDVRDGSDLDLLVVEAQDFGPRRSRWKEITTIRRALRPFRGPKDILVYSRGEAERLRESRNHVVGEAFREGKVLYGE